MPKVSMCVRTPMRTSLLSKCAMKQCIILDSGKSAAVFSIGVYIIQTVQSQQVSGVNADVVGSHA